MLSIGNVWETFFLIATCCGRAHQGSSLPSSAGQEAALLHGSASAPAPGLLPWVPALTAFHAGLQAVSWNKPFAPQVALGCVFLTAAEKQLEQTLSLGWHGPISGTFILFHSSAGLLLYDVILHLGVREVSQLWFVFQYLLGYISWI